MRHTILGAGQIGSALAEVLGRDTRNVVTTRDLGGERGLDPDVLHVAFPWTEAFDRAVLEYQAEYGFPLTVIHSTVPVGTSRRLRAVHSPVTGRHPHLADSLRVFTKMIGAEDRRQARRVAQMFADAGMWTATMANPETTELAKLWATLQYGVLIALQKEAYRLAVQLGADPEGVYDEANAIYNRGYSALGEPYRLPILRDVPGPIGGHCVIPNLAFTPGPLAILLADLNGMWAELDAELREAELEEHTTAWDAAQRREAVR